MMNENLPSLNIDSNSLYNPASFTRKTEAKKYGLGYEKSAFQDH
jgi:hypothetical protein